MVSGIALEKSNLSLPSDSGRKEVEKRHNTSLPVGAAICRYWHCAKSFAAAHGLAAWCHGQSARRDPARLARAADHARQVVTSGTDDAVSLAYAGFALVLSRTDVEGGVAAVSRATEISPNSVTVLTRSAVANALAGHPVNRSFMAHSAISRPSITALRKDYSITSSAVATSACGTVGPNGIDVLVKMERAADGQGKPLH
jgi:hypothetical protein